MANEAYLSSSQQAALRALDRLGEAPLAPQTASALAEDLGLTKDAAFRALQNLEHAGFAERLGAGWRLAPRLARISERLRADLHGIHRTYLDIDGEEEEST